MHDSGVGALTKVWGEVEDGTKDVDSVEHLPEEDCETMSSNTSRLTLRVGEGHLPDGRGNGSDFHVTDC